MKKKKFLIITSILGILIFIIITSDKRNLTIIEKSSKDIFSFVIKPINKLRIKKCENNTEDNILKAENEELKENIKNLKDLLGLKTILSEYEKINATVIDRNLGYWYDTLTIDKGSNDGIIKNQAVITTKGLIGYIYNTSYTTSTVKLITSKLENKISVKIKNNDSYTYGLLTQYENGNFIIEGITEDVKIDSIVTTSGLGNGFPEGIYIGKVSEVNKDNFDLIKNLKVKSDLNYDLISLVSVLKNDNFNNNINNFRWRIFKLFKYIFPTIFTFFITNNL